jgi:hypothetical protein
VLVADLLPLADSEEGRGLTDEGEPDGLQAPGHGARPVAAARWCTPPAARPRLDDDRPERPRRDVRRERDLAACRIKVDRRPGARGGKGAEPELPSCHGGATDRSRIGSGPRGNDSRGIAVSAVVGARRRFGAVATSRHVMMEKGALLQCQLALTWPGLGLALFLRRPVLPPFARSRGPSSGPSRPLGTVEQWRPLRWRPLRGP